MKRLFCRLFGHDMYTEVYAERRTAYRKRQPIAFYRVIERTYCERCGFQRMEIVSGWMRRAELLQRGWFIEKRQ